MRDSRTRRLIVAPAVAVLLVLALAATAFAWDSSCTSSKACVWENSSFVVPIAAVATSDSNYVWSYYPNTLDSLNDTVSSIKNAFSSYDVVWFFSTSYSGTSYCLDSGWASGQLNSHNDQYSSHLVAVGSTC